MTIPPAVVSLSRQLWRCQWLALMNGLAPADNRGGFRRRPSCFRETLLGSGHDQGVPRHVLIIGQSCPWAHRTWLVRQLKDLASVIDMSVVHPNPATGRWIFREPFEGVQQLWQLYRNSGAGSNARATVPVLWDRYEGRIINNESAVYQLPKVAATCPSETWRQDYFGSLFPLNPSGIVPKAPPLARLLDFPFPNS